MVYEVWYYNINRDSVLVSEKIPARHLSDALWKIWEYELKHPNCACGTFKLTKSEVDALNIDNPKFHIFNTKQGYACILIDQVKIYDPQRNSYLLELRAKREMLGISLEKMVELTAQADYKDRELGHRKVTIDEYARYMLILNDYWFDFYSD